MALFTFLFSSQTVFATEQLEKLSGEIGRNTMFDSFATEIDESVNSTGEQTELPIFLLVIEYEGDKDFMHMFYMEDIYGTGGSYLVSSVGVSVFAEAGAELYAVVGDEVREVEYLGRKDSLSYLKFDGVEVYEPLSLKEAMTNDDMIAVMVGVNEDNQFEQEAYLMEVAAWEEYEGYYSSGEEVESLVDLGVPTFDEDSYELVGMFEINLDTNELVVLDMTQISYEANYALATDTPQQSTETAVSPEATETEPVVQEPESSQPVAQEEPAVAEPVETEVSTEEAEVQSEPPQSSFLSSVPGWAYAAAVILIIGAIYTINNQKKKGKSKAEHLVNDVENYQEGTIALDTGGTQMAEETMMGEPVGALWQVRGMSGIFMGQTFSLTDILRFGRNPQHQVVYPQNTKGISGDHCELSMENGRIVLRDLGSTYGTFLKDGAKLNERVSYEVKEGDIFYLAESSQSFRIERIGESRQEYTPAVKAAVNPKAGETYRADANGRIQFGRSAHCQVSFGASDAKISTNHCVLYREEDALYLMDLGSTNGTYFTENKRLQPNVPYKVEKGMAFYLASQNYLFVITED